MFRKCTQLLSLGVFSLAWGILFFVLTPVVHAEQYEARASITPSAGVSPLTVHVNLSVDSQLLCTAFSIDWGDNSTTTQYVPDDFSHCSGGVFSRDFSHTYNPDDEDTPKLFTITAKAGPHPLAELHPLTLTAVVYKDSEQYASSTQSTTQNNDSTSCFITPASGYAPFRTAAYIPLGGDDCNSHKPMKYYVEWGDGATSTVKTCHSDRISYDTLTHTYATTTTMTAILHRTYHPGESNEETTEETCTVTVKKRPFLSFIRPQKGQLITIGAPTTLSVSASNLPGEINGLKPKLRFLFLTPEGKAGFIGDVNSLAEGATTSTYTFNWTPTTKSCPDDKVCQTPIVPGRYRIAATVLYDICKGDPFCGKRFPTVIATTSDEVEVSKVSSWMFKVSDRLFAYPQTSHAPATVYFTGVFNSDASCLGGTYTIDFGDETSQTIVFPRGKCASFASSFSHTYSHPGVYLVAVRRNGIPITYLRVAVLDTVSAASNSRRQVASVWEAIKDMLRRWFSRY